MMSLSRKLTFVLFITIILMFVQCKKNKSKSSSSTSSPTSNTEQQGNGKFEFKANGVQYQFNKMVGAYENNSVSGSDLHISAAGNTGYQALGSISNFSVVETNSITSGFSLTFYFNYIPYGIVPGNSMYANSHGTIQVTEIKIINGKRYAKGIFSGVAYRNSTDSLVITNGIFQDQNF